MTLPQPFRQTAIAVTAAIAATMVVAMYAVTYIGESWGASASTLQFAGNALSTGINLLLLTFGYCGLRMSWKSVIMLALVALSYDAINLSFVSMVGSHLPVWDSATSDDTQLASTALTMISFPVSSMPGRLIHGYLFLLILSPLINRGLSALSRHQLSSLVIILTASVTVCGWLAENYLAWWHWNLYYFIYLYAVGYLLRVHRPLDRVPARLLITGIALCFAGLAMTIFVHDWISGPWTYWFDSHYANDLFTLSASILTVAYVSRSRRAYAGPPWLATAILGSFMLITGPAATCITDMVELSIRSNMLSFTVICLATTALAALTAWIIYDPVMLVAGAVGRRLPRLSVATASQPLQQIGTSIRSSQRNSSIELARVLAMCMIMGEHLTFSHVAPGFESYDSWAVVFFGITSCCVSVYVILLGTLGLRLSWKAVINIWLTVLLFNILSLIIIIGIGRTPNEFPAASDLVKHLIFPIGSSSYWFIKAYLMLITLAPLINAGLKQVDIQSLRLLVLTLTCAGIYCGWIGQNPLHDMLNYWGFDHNGSIFPADTIYYFIWLYVVGWWISRDTKLHSIPLTVLVSGFILSGLIQGALHLLTIDATDVQKSLFSPAQRHGLLVNLSAFFFVCFFIRFSFRSKFVNLLGSASLGCYLIQESRPGCMLYYDVLSRFFNAHSFSLSFWLMIAGSFLGTWLLAVIIFHYKRRWMPPLIEKIISCLPRKWKQEIW